MNPELSNEASDLLRRALGLPAEARAALANSLLESIDDAVDASAEEEWGQEIARRIQELDSGSVKAIPWTEAKRRISAMLNDQ
jgi:putative addiction module component (TIGR02574 family)